MQKKSLMKLIIVGIVLISSIVYGVSVNEREEKTLNLHTISDKKVVSKLKKITENEEKMTIKSKNNFDEKMIDYTKNITGLTHEEVLYLLGQCKKKDLNIFVVLGLMKVESNFNKYCVGSLGERGLGQLMENTAKPLAYNLGIEYDPDKLFEPKYNILLFTTQLKYLKKLFDNDMHKVLTAYNRGQYGLKRYMASRSDRKNPAKSVYSDKVLEYAVKYQNEFKKWK
ncbi:lytic transglycosylase domain-containing protein [Thermohalobacter berrensis]|uniref:Transglycosylase SLT domain-containing protein n=1 Tax=Thermohalobacter berrensis TaxID=99594 RepID=A0A419T4Z7_9FIRM|nr:transglycosylase SLT domain-containing protein [Thermohalobacter berrensis]RKD32561.1 hypothetical protein BET03_10825 [Thermohalobacter berrensis]